jgi:hypothetical protein
VVPEGSSAASSARFPGPAASAGSTCWLSTFSPPSRGTRPPSPPGVRRGGSASTTATTSTTTCATPRLWKRASSSGRTTSSRWPRGRRAHWKSSPPPPPKNAEGQGLDLHPRHAIGSTVFSGNDGFSIAAALPQPPPPRGRHHQPPRRLHPLPSPDPFLWEEFRTAVLRSQG